MQDSFAGYVSLAAFVAAYLLVIFEEKLHLRKSKPMVLVGCLMWAFIGAHEAFAGKGHAGGELRQHLLVAFVDGIANPHAELVQASPAPATPASSSGVPDGRFRSWPANPLM